MKEIYVSLDIEADGPIPGPYSMLSIGAAAFTLPNPVPVSTFTVNLERLLGATQFADTMAWWAKFPDAYAAATKDAKPPEAAMADLAAWVKTLPGKPVGVVYPTWDYMWIHWYFIKFLGVDPFGLAYLDIKSYLFRSGLVSKDFRGTSKRNIPAWMLRGAPAHSHVATDDAIEQGVIFVNADGKAP